MFEPLEERLDAHFTDAALNQLTNRIVHHGGGNAGLETEAVGQVRGHVVFATRDVNFKVLGFAERDDAWIESMHQGTERKEVELAIVFANVQLSHGSSCKKVCG